MWASTRKECFSINLSSLVDLSSNKKPNKIQKWKMDAAWPYLIWSKILVIQNCFSVLSQNVNNFSLLQMACVLKTTGTLFCYSSEKKHKQINFAQISWLDFGITKIKLGLKKKRNKNDEIVLHFQLCQGNKMSLCKSLRLSDTISICISESDVNKPF